MLFDLVLFSEKDVEEETAELALWLLQEFLVAIYDSAFKFHQLLSRQEFVNDEGNNSDLFIGLEENLKWLRMLLENTNMCKLSSSRKVRLCFTIAEMMMQTERRFSSIDSRALLALKIHFRQVEGIKRLIAVIQVRPTELSAHQCFLLFSIFVYLHLRLINQSHTGEPKR